MGWERLKGAQQQRWKQPENWKGLKRYKRWAGEGVSNGSTQRKEEKIWQMSGRWRLTSWNVHTLTTCVSLLVKWENGQNYTIVFLRIILLIPHRTFPSVLNKERSDELSAGLTWGKVILMRLNRLCRRPEMWVLPPPGGPIDAIKNMS